jgi:hypothetical protein
VSVSIALDPTQAPIPESYEELRSEVAKLRMTVGFMSRDIQQSRAEANASAAHCTIMMRAASAAKAELESLKRKTRRSVKTSARYVTHPALREQWAAKQEEKECKERDAAQKEAQKAVDEAARKLQIHRAIQTRVFTGKSLLIFIG